MFLIECPWCGERDQSEFGYGGEAHIKRPENSEEMNDAEWADYVFHRKNTLGIHYERWVHSHGCGQWFNAARNTATDEWIRFYKIGEKPPKKAS